MCALVTGVQTCALPIYPAEFLPANGMPEPMTLEPNKEYVRDVLERTVDLTAFDAQFITIDDLPDDHRYFEYKAKVNADGSPTEQVINRHRVQFCSEYRFSTEGAHPNEQYPQQENN